MRANKMIAFIARIGRTSAVKASGTASGFGTYQPKEPVAIKVLEKQKKSK